MVKVISRKKVLAVKINAGNNSNGNPRRGWFVYDREGYFQGFVDDGYAGYGGLRKLFPNVIEVGTTIPTTPTAYREAMKKRVPGGFQG